MSSASVLGSTLSLAHRCLFVQPIKPLFNNIQTANAWVGSYRIRNLNEHLDSFPRPRRWSRYNEIIQPPQTDPNEDRRPATYYHYRANIKYSPKKMWYVCRFVQGLNVDEAIRQCSFHYSKGAQVMADVLKEAQHIAVTKHNFEFKSNMWVEDVKAVKGLVIKGIKKHARMRFGEVRYFYVHVCVKLTEGEPPKHYLKPDKDGNDHLRDHYDRLRSRKIEQGL